MSRGATSLRTRAGSRVRVGPSLGSVESVNAELSSERADANKLWCRDGEFTKGVAHPIVGEASNGEVGEGTIYFDVDEENGHNGQ